MKTTTQACRRARLLEADLLAQRGELDDVMLMALDVETHPHNLTGEP